MGFKFRLPGYSIKRVLIISFLLISLLPPSIIASLSYVTSYKEIEEKISVYSQQIINQTTDKLDFFLKNIEDISLQIVTSSKVQDGISEIENNVGEGYQSVNEKKMDIQHYLNNIISTRNEIVGATIMLENSETIIIAGETMVDKHNFEDSQIYKDTFYNDETLLWNETFYNSKSRVTYPYITTLSRKIKADSTGETLGVLVLSIKEFAIADTYSYIDIGPTGFVFITDSTGEYVSHLNKRRLTEESEYDFVKQIILKQDINQLRTFSSSLDNEKVLVSYAVSDITGWYIVSVAPYSYLMESVKEIQSFTIKASVVVFILSIIFSILISLSISRPVETLSSAMNEVEAGNLDVSVNLSTKNEIGRLGNHFNSMVSRIRELIKKNYESEILKKNAEIKTLQSQINPHFLYNTLAVIDGIASMKNEHQISEITQILADIFRYSTSGDKTATIEDEIEYIKKYLYIQKVRYNHRLQTNVNIDPATRLFRIEKLLIQPIVENAIVHGIEHKKDGGFIEVNVFSVSETEIDISVFDNGLGMDEERLIELKHALNEGIDSIVNLDEKGRYHIGICNVNKRIKNYYGEQYGLEITSKKGRGTLVTFRVPKKA